ncbi:hypothetical protein ACLB2K_043842 [Fragaria x ananassa]
MPSPQRPRSLFLPGESVEFQFSGEITQNFKQNRSRRKIGIRLTRRGEKVIGDVAEGHWGGGAASSEPYGGERRHVRTLRVCGRLPLIPIVYIYTDFLSCGRPHQFFGADFHFCTTFDRISSSPPSSI